MPGGRPSEYDEKYCQGIIDFCKEGRSFVAYAAKIDKNVDTLYEWASKHPKFSEAKDIAKQKCQAFFEEAGRKGMFGEIEGFGHTNWIFNMKARFGWADKQVIEQKTEIKAEVKLDVTELEDRLNDL